jgi:hypothetical protein
MIKKYKKFKNMRRGGELALDWYMEAQLTISA